MKNVLMLLSNPFRPDIRPYLEAKALVEKGYGVTILCWDRECKYPEKEVIEGIHIERIRLRSQKGALYPLRLMKFHRLVVKRARAMDFDVVHAHDYDTLKPAIKLARGGKKLVYDIHEIYSMMIRVDVPAFVASMVQRSEDRLMKKADKALVTLEEAKEHYVRRGVPADKISVVMNSKDWGPVDPAKVAELRRELDLEGKFVIVFIGTLGEGKFLRELLELSEGFGDEVLLLGGYGDMEGEVRARAGDKVRFLGTVAPGDVPAYLSLGDVGVCMYHPSMEQQKIGIVSKFFDYVHVGLPCIINEELTKTAQVAREEDCALLIPYGKKEFALAVRRLRTEEGLAERLGENISRLQSRYHWSRNKESLLAVYEELLE